MHSSQDASDIVADRGKLDAAANPSFDELSGTLCSEIAQRLPRYPVRLHVYDLGQAKGISGLNIVTKGLQMVGPAPATAPSVPPTLLPLTGHLLWFWVCLALSRFLS